MTRTTAARVDAASVQLGEGTYYRQPNAEASFRPRQSPVALGEQLEHLRQLLRRNPRAIILDGQDNVTLLLRCAQGDLAAFVGVLGGIGEEIDDHLLQTHDVPVEEEFSKVVHLL